MSDYAIVNLLELDDAVGDRVDGLEARFGRTAIESRDLGVSLFQYGLGVRPPFSHKHREQEEAYVVVRGFEAGPDGLDVIAIGGPKPEGGDGEPSDDPWPDADAG